MTEILNSSKILLNVRLSTVIFLILFNTFMDMFILGEGLNSYFEDFKILKMVFREGIPWLSWELDRVRGSERVISL